jgi:hypothetical protein
VVSKGLSNLLLILLAVLHFACLDEHAFYSELIIRLHKTLKYLYLLLPVLLEVCRLLDMLFDIPEWADLYRAGVLLCAGLVALILPCHYSHYQGHLRACKDPLLTLYALHHFKELVQAEKGSPEFPSPRLRACFEEHVGQCRAVSCPLRRVTEMPLYGQPLSEKERSWVYGKCMDKMLAVLDDLKLLRKDLWITLICEGYAYRHVGYKNFIRSILSLKPQEYTFF